MTEIIDRKPENKKKGMTKLQTFLAVIAFIAVFGFIYIINHNPNAKKDMVVINVGGIDIIPGETKIADFLEAGFELGLNYKENIIDETQPMEKDSYVPLIVLTKDQKSYGTIAIGNDSGKEAPISKGIILSIAVYDSNENADNVTADQVAIKNMTEEGLIEAYGEPDSREEDTDMGGSKLEWENKGYYFTVNIGEDQKIQRIDCSQGHY